MDNNTQIIKEFWEKVMHGEITQYDFSNPDHRLAYYDALGTDEEILKRDYPHLFHVVSNDLIEKEMEEGEMGFTTVPEASLLSTGRNNGMNGQARVNFTQNKQLILLNAKLINTSRPDQPQMCVNPYIKSDHIIQMKDLVLTPPFRFGMTETYELRNTITAYRKDGSMESAMAFSAPQLIRNDTDVVERVEIDKPKKIKSKKYSDCCLIVYNRNAEAGDSADDVFPKVIVDKSKEPKEIQYHQGFAGRIVLTDDWEIDYSNWTASGVVITAEFINKDIGGSVQYNGTSNIKALFSSSDPHILEWNLIKSKDENFENWKGSLYAKHVENDAKLRFYAYIPFTIKPSLSNVSDAHSSADNAHITIESAYPFDDSTKHPAYKQVCYIWIWWGCLGKDTLITLFDGRVLPICEVTETDTVRTESGDLEIISIFKGYEETLIYLETNEGDTLFATDSHPVMTQRGLVRAEHLNAGDCVKTPSGFVGIKSLYLKDYCDDVYGLQLSQNCLLYCSNILTGDFGTQQEQIDRKEQQMEPAEFDKDNKAVVDLLRFCVNQVAPDKKRCQHNLSIAPATPYTACAMLYPEDHFLLSLKNEGVSWDSKDNCFTLAFWAKISGESRSMVSQEKGFRFGTDGNTLVFSLPGKQEFTADLSVSIGQIWHHYSLLFDGKVLSLALDGIVMGESDSFNGSRILQEELPLIFGSGFTGYLQKCVLYQEAIAISVIRRRMFQYVLESEDSRIFALLDMSKERVRDIGMHALDVQSKGACIIRNLVSCYQPSARSYAQLKGAPKLNPGGFSSKSFGIYLRFYSAFLSNKKGILLSNGPVGKSDSVILFVSDMGNDLLQFSIALGLHETVIATDVPKFVWIDLFVSYDHSSEKLTSYLNGEKTLTAYVGTFQRTSAGSVIIGNGFSETEHNDDYTCDCGYALVALFDCAIYEDAVRQLSEQPPYLFDKNLVALYHFEHQPPMELVTGQQIHLKSEDLVTLESTVNQISNKQYRYRIETDVKHYDVEAIKLYQLLKIYYYDMFGISPGNVLNKEILSAIYTYLTKTLLCNPDVQRLFTVETITNTMLAKLLLTLTPSVTSILFRLMYANHSSNEQEDDMSAKLGYDNVLLKADTVSFAGHYAVVYCRSKEFMKQIFDRMRSALTD